MKFAQRRDYYAGALIMLLGAGAAIVGSRYNIGSLTRMGPGFFPTILGILLAVIGVLIAGSASYGAKSDAVETAMRPDWRLGSPASAAVIFAWSGEKKRRIPSRSPAPTSGPEIANSPVRAIFRSDGKSRNRLPGDGSNGGRSHFGPFFTIPSVCCLNANGTVGVPNRRISASHG